MNRTTVCSLVDFRWSIYQGILAIIFKESIFVNRRWVPYLLGVNNFLFFSEIILVNRGWVPRDKLDPKTRPEGQLSDTIELTGIVRKGEARPQFTPKAKGSHFLYR